jgi:hypothetical protein
MIHAILSNDTVTDKASLNETRIQGVKIRKVDNRLRKNK